MSIIIVDMYFAMVEYYLLDHCVLNESNHQDGQRSGSRVAGGAIVASCDFFFTLLR